MKMNTGKWYDVYFLIDPFIMQVFYVGMSEDSTQRYLQHIQMKDGNTQKNERIAAIMAHGSLPLLYVGIRVQGTEGALFYEGLYTEVFLSCGQPLTNSVMKINARDDSYIEHRELLVSFYKSVDLHIGGPFYPAMAIKVAEMPDNMRRELHDLTVKKLEGMGCTVTVSKYRDIYGTHRRIEAVRPKKLRMPVSGKMSRVPAGKRTLMGTLQRICSLIKGGNSK
jgi:hypothetical protein